MEALRRKFMNDPNIYPELSKKRPSDSSPSVVSISSSSSGDDVDIPRKSAAKPSAYRVISSDESDEGTDLPSSQSEQAQTSKASKVSSKEAYTHPVPNPSKHMYPSPAPGGSPAIAIPVPKPFDHFRPVSPDVQGSTEDKISDLPSEYAYISPTDAEKALRDLMGGGMNGNEDAEIDEEDAYVEGFREGIKLLPHQVQGRNWMKDREDPSKKRYGGLLADDMGLGKTIQTLTRIVDNRPRKSDRAEWDPPTLIVCPLALVEQWASEIQKMVSGLTVVRHQGSGRTSDPLKLKQSHVVITTYDTVRSEYQSYRPEIKDEGKKSTKKKPVTVDDDSDSESSFEKTRPVKKKSGSKKDALFHVHWWRAVLDEAHNIKNRNAKGSQACCEIDAKYRWCLTGTPMQNEVLELFSLIKFLRIKPLSDFTIFNEQIAKPVKNGRGGVRAMKRLQVVLKQIMLRRTKDQTLNGKALIDLPPRIVEVVSCPFDTQEQEFYTALETRVSSVVDDLSKQQNASYIGALVLLLRLRQACDHPLLVSKDYKVDMEAINPKDGKAGSQESQDADDLAEVFGTLNVASRTCELCTTVLTEKNTESGLDNHCLTCAKLTRNRTSKSSSAKIRMTLKLLRDTSERDSAEKTIIFSQFTSMLNLMEPFLRDEGIKYVRYDGSMQTVQREASLRKIKTDPDVQAILVSFKAGSTGLNLTACSNVILVDLWWNPALEDQAFDRAHRYGQTRQVNIYKLKIDNTVEERILTLQDKKRELARAALSGEKIKNMRLGMDELLALFRPGGRDDDEED